MTLYKPVNNDFQTNITRALNNTTNFEQSSTYEKYRDEEDADSTSALDLYNIESVIINQVAPILKTVAETRRYDERDEARYRFRPMQLSKDVYGMVDFWYIILAVNDFQSPYEFKDFKTLLVPTQSQIETIMDQAKFNGLSVGVGKVKV